MKLQEIADEIEMLVQFVDYAIPKLIKAGVKERPIEKAAIVASTRIEAWLASQQPNHLDDKTLDH